MNKLLSQVLLRFLILLFMVGLCLSFSFDPEYDNRKAKLDAYLPAPDEMTRSVLNPLT